jgi:hypothetical protein
MKKGDKISFTVEVTIASIEVNKEDDNKVDIVGVITDHIWPVDKGAPRLQSTITFPKDAMGVDPVLRSGVLQITKRDVLYYSAMGILSAYRDKLAASKLMTEAGKLFSSDKPSPGVGKKGYNVKESKIICPRCDSTNYERERRPNGFTRCLDCKYKALSKEWDNQKQE